MMTQTKPQSLINAESHRFNANASRLLMDEIPEFFDSLGLKCVRYKNSYRMVCPVCITSNIWIATAGDVYPIYWGCLSKSCPSRAKTYVKNLIGLVRACLGGCSMPVAFKTISAHLDYPNPYDITNLADEGVQEARRAGDTTPPSEGCGTVFVVPSEGLRALFHEAGVEAVLAGKGVPRGRRVIVMDDPLEWDFLSPDDIRQKVERMAQ